MQEWDCRRFFNAIDHDQAITTSVCRSIISSYISAFEDDIFRSYHGPVTPLKIFPEAVLKV